MCVQMLKSIVKNLNLFGRSLSAVDTEHTIQEDTSIATTKKSKPVIKTVQRNLQGISRVLSVTHILGIKIGAKINCSKEYGFKCR